MRQSARILLNTILMFGRMLFTFGVGLYATRVLINVLGHSDYGILAALGATGALLLFTGRALNVSAQRYLAYEIGRGEGERLSAVFNATFVLFAGLGAALLLVGIAVEPWIIEAVRIPPERTAAASRVFYFTLFGLVATTAGTPWNAVINARQAMGLVALHDSLRSVIRLVSVLLLLVVDGDSLVLYAGFLMVSATVRALGMAAVCAYRFPESRPRLSLFRVAEIDRVSRFAGWSSLLAGGYLVYNHATVVLIGMAFPPVITAAYAIAMSVGDYHTNFARVLPRVVQPAMTGLEARGNRGYVQSLALLTGKYSCLGVLLFVVPLMLEAEGLLALWLESYPAEAPFFVRMTLLWLTIQVSSNGLDRAVYAKGSVRLYALCTTGVWLLALGIGSFLLFGLGLGAWSMLTTLVVAAVAQIPLRVGYAGRLIGLGYGDWMRETVARVVAPLAAGLVPAWLVHNGLEDGWLRYAMVGIAYGLGALPVMWLVSVGAREKRVFADLLRAGRDALKNWWQN